MATKVSINVYDISGGLASQMSQMILGKKIDGIWHTGVIVFGKEYYFGGGICTDPIGQTPYGTPVKSEEVGETEVPEELFQEFLQDLAQKYTDTNYDLIKNNCNHFANDCVEFLTGEGLPSYILGLIDEIASAPMGAMILNMLGGMQEKMQGQGHQLFTPQTFQGDNAQANDQVKDMLNQMQGNQNPPNNQNPPKDSNPGGDLD